MSEQENKLKLIEEDLKNKASEIEKSEKLLSNKEKLINSKLNIVGKEELFLSITKYINDIFSIYESSMGTSEGCKELVTNLIEAKNKIDAQLLLMGPGKLMNK
jgi:nucleosome binding factor SPN SPT16 subunit